MIDRRRSFESQVAARDDLQSGPAALRQNFRFGGKHIHPAARRAGPWLTDCEGRLAGAYR
jgi:hypothetical protein